MELRLPTWGGKRKDAGRKPKGEKAGVSHAQRPALSGHHPVLITMRRLDRLWSLRSKRSYTRIRAACERLRETREGGFRVAQFSVQGNHLHLVVEAEGREQLSRGMQALAISIAKRLNRMMGRRGSVFADRYHARILRTPREVRYALNYVLNNARKHFGKPRRAFDRFCSGAYFDGWVRGTRGQEAVTGPPPISRPRSWLLRVGWRKCGLIVAA